ncbi:hypothetical protein [Ramlibacter sp. WS9]|uniref:hypothetical protein n=1 Tax=Ramlibacter sp. WS9 TaxID=1882741 RepID=UPI0011437554|nr:hypothetical protein [Ramlibacter sp. WS9]
MRVLPIKRVIFASMLGVGLMSAFAQQAPRPVATPEVSVPLTREERCRVEISNYLGTIQFLRWTAGQQIGDKVAKGYVSEMELDKLVAEKGPCGAAQVLKEKGATR